MKYVLIFFCMAFCFRARAQETLQTVTDRGNSTTNSIQIGGASVNANTTKLFINNPVGKKWALSAGANMISEMGFNIYNWTDNQTTPLFTITNVGNVGIGAFGAAAKLHISGTGVAKDATGQFNGDVVIQANSGNRSATQGAQLEFVVPANTDGSNPWGQGRIVTVAGNANNGDATGKMILGTRRLMDKNGTVAWYYGEDLAIDGSGNVGVGTIVPQEKLSVNGKIRAQEIKVEAANWPDYVFKPSYKLTPLSQVENFIKQNGHLPEVPAAKEVAEKGVE
ncbi:MAG: hypothetical protein J7539_16075, partial [Niabella sp.]|nr:hypothetical protein [Niabella sp.]